MKIDNVEVTPINVEVAKKIWDITKISPEMGNAVMDVLGDEVYDRVMKIQSTKV